MVRKTKVLLLLVGTLLLVSACSNGETLQKKEYQTFKDQITDDDFTGYAYILSDYKAKDDDYLATIKEVFEEENSNLIYFDAQSASNEMYENFNDDSSKKDLYLPNDDIAYFENGEVVNEFEITKYITSYEEKQKLQEFVAQHNE